MARLSALLGPSLAPRLHIRRMIAHSALRSREPDPT